MGVKWHVFAAVQSFLFLFAVATLIGCSSRGAVEVDNGAAVSALSQGLVTLVAQHSGKCVGVSGKVATQQTCTGVTSQEWSFKSVTGGFQIVSAVDSTQCLNIAGASMTAGQAVAVSSCSSGGVAGEIWSSKAVGNDVNLVATHSSQCMDVAGVSKADGAAVIQWTCNGQTNQLWAVTPVTPIADASVDSPPGDATTDSGGGSGVVTLVAQHSGKCVGVSGNLATQQTCTGATSQEWAFKSVTGGFQIVSAVNATQCLNIAGASTTAGQSVAVTACSSGGVPGEIWSSKAVGSNLNLIATQSKQCMDVMGVSTADGASIIQWTCNGQANQVWAATPVVVGPPLVELVSKNSGLCVSIQGSGALQETCIGATSQKWTFKAVTGGSQIVSALDPTLCLVVPSGSTTAGQATAVATCSSGGVAGEIWTTTTAGAYVTLVDNTSQQCMDVAGVSLYSGGIIDQYTCNGQANQLWTLQPAPADPVNTGQWSALIQFPSIPVAAAMLPSGKILTWASWEPDNQGTPDAPQTYTTMFDPQTLSVTPALVTQTNHDMFCPGTAMLSDGRILINGGGPVVANTSIYDSLNVTWTADALMNQARWYNVSVTLPDGRVFTLGGNRVSGLDGTGEIWTPGAGWKTVPGALMAPIVTTDTTNRSQEHPRLFVAPNGKIFVPGPTPNMQWYDLTGNGSIQSAGPRGDDVFSQNDVTVMIDVGKLLKAGGNTNYDQPNASTTPSSTNAYIIDINGGGLAAVTKVAPLKHGRAYATGVLLPDGRVFVVGGLDNGKAFTDNGAVLTPELFDPATSTWRDLLPIDVPRTYHSVALLMPDARVFVGGGGLCGTGCAANHFDAQIYSPPYLFQGSRPQITSAPAAASYGSAVAVTTTGTVTGFVWIRMSSVTHTVNTDQRRLTGNSTSSGSGSYSVTAPASANIAPPGYYMLFALNGGIPSVARMVRIGP